MAKLTKIILKDSDEQHRTRNEPTTLKKKIEAESVQISPSFSPSEKGAEDVVIDDTGSDIDEVIFWLYDFLEEDLLSHIKENPNLHLPFAEPTISVKDWFSRAVKTFLNYEDIQEIGKLINNKIIGVNSKLTTDKLKIESENSENHRRLQLINEKLTKQQESLDNAELAKFKLEKQLAVSIPIKDFVLAFYTKDFEFEIKEILLESTEGATRDLGNFIITFSKSWNKLKKVEELNLENTQDQLDEFHKILTELLSEISGLYIAQRRTLLDKVGQWVSTKFEDYIFVSPEETLQLDPNIHNARGLSNTNIIEGVSYAIIRRASRQTVIYAEVKVN